MALKSDRQSVITCVSVPDPTWVASTRSNNDSSDEDSSYSVQFTPSNKRKKSSKKSCEKCKARKVKCDRNVPVCGWCTRNNEPCLYKKRRAGYGLRATQEHKLEEKIKRLEAMLLLLGRRFEDHVDSNQRSGPSQPSISPLHMSFHSALLGQSSVGSGSQMTCSLESSNAGPIEQVQYQRQSDSISLPCEGTSVPDDLANPQSPNSCFTDARSCWTSDVSDTILPPYTLLCSLVDLYFKHVNTWCPILDHYTILQTLSSSPTPDDADCVLFHAIVAISLRFSEDPSLTPESRRQYHDSSRQKVQMYGLEQTNLRSLQALVILALESLGTSDGVQACYLALIAKKVTQLGLSLEKKFILSPGTHSSIVTVPEVQLPQKMSWTEDEERRRIFWMVYLIDRYFTIETTLQFALNDREIDRQLPCRYDLFSRNRPVQTRRFHFAELSETTVDTPDNLGSFSHHCELLILLSRIHDFLSSPLDISSTLEVNQWQNQFRTLDAELDAWLFRLPVEYSKISQLCHSDPNSKISNWVVLHAAYITAVVHLHSAAAYPSVCSHIFKPSYNAMQKCVAAVVSLKEIASDVIDSMLELLGPVFSFSLWVAARLLLVHASILEHELDPNISFFICTLDRIGRYWKVAQNYAEVLSRLVREHQDSKQSGTSVYAGAFPTSKTFTGMRRLVTVTASGCFESSLRDRAHSRAFQLNLLMSQQRNSVLNPMSITAAAPSELDNLAVFDFFNYPRLHTKDGSSSYTSDMMDILDNFALIDGYPMTYYAMPDPESDWFTFTPVHLSA